LAAKKFTGEQRRQILAWIANGFGATLICQFIKDKWQMVSSRENIQKNYIEAKKSEWMEMRREADKHLQDHPLWAKKHRLDIIMEGIQEALTWRTKQLLQHKGDIVAEIEQKYIQIIAPLMAEASKLIEGTKGTEITINNWQSIVEAAHAKQRDNRQCEGHAGSVPEGSELFQRKGIGDAPLGIEGPRTDPDNGKLKRSLKNGSQVMQRSREVEVGSGSGSVVSHKPLPGEGDNNSADLYAG
jgi:hypothetical protein